MTCYPGATDWAYACSRRRPGQGRVRYRRRFRMYRNVQGAFFILHPLKGKQITAVNKLTGHNTANISDAILVA